jgi:GH24 family phage-related lysozyme (muramidase)
MTNTVDKVISIAISEEGYLEKSADAYKKDPSVLDRKTDGAGSDNYTKYGRDMHALYPSVMDFPAYWCDCFVDWCFYKAYGAEEARKLLCGNFDDYTVNSSGMYKKAGQLDTTPTVGAQVFFTKNGQTSGCYHTGLVYHVDGTYFYTVEGNTTGASGIIANGGGVAKKKYSISGQKGKVLFGHPKYDTIKKSIKEIAQEVIDGKWGQGIDRKNRLHAAGYDYAEVQKEVNKRYAANHVSQAGIDLIKKFEGCRLKAYRLPGEKYFTIGYGHSGADVYESMTISQSEAENLLRNDLVKFEGYVKKYVTDIVLTQHRLDALVSYTYNRGPGKLSAELAANCHTVEEYADGIVKYWGSAQRYKDALIRRRKEERALFLS